MIFINRSEKQRQRIQWPESAKYIPTASPPTRIDNKRKIKTKAATIMRRDADYGERFKESVADVLSGCSAFVCAG